MSNSDVELSCWWIGCLCLAVGAAVQRQAQDWGAAPVGLLQLHPSPAMAPSRAQPFMHSADRMADAANPFVASLLPPSSAKPMLSGLSALAGGSTLAPTSPRQQAVGSAAAPPELASVAEGSASVVLALPNPFDGHATPSPVRAGHSTAAPVSDVQQVPFASEVGSDSVTGSLALTPARTRTPASASTIVMPAVTHAAHEDIPAAAATTAAPVHSSNSMIPSASTIAATVTNAQVALQVSKAINARASASMSTEPAALHADVAAKPLVASAPAPPVELQGVNATGTSALSAPSVPEAASLCPSPVAATPAVGPAPMPAAAAATDIPLASVAAMPAKASVPAFAPPATANLPTPSAAAAVPAASACLPTVSATASAPAPTANLPPHSVAAAEPATVLAAVPAALTSNRPASKRKWDVMAQPQPDAGTATTAAPHAVAVGTADGSRPLPLVSMLPTDAPGSAANNSAAAGHVQLPNPGEVHEA